MSTNKSITSIRQAQLIAGSLLAATVGYAVVGTVLVLIHVIPEGGMAEMPSQTGLAVKVVLLVAGIGAAGGSFLMRRILDSQAPKGDEGMPVRFRNRIVAMALGESAGVMGFVVALLTGDTLFSLLLWGVAIAVCVLHFPTRAGFGLSQ